MRFERQPEEPMALRGLVSVGSLTDPGSVTCRSNISDLSSSFRMLSLDNVMLDFVDATALHDKKKSLTTEKLFDSESSDATEKCSKTSSVTTCSNTTAHHCRLATLTCLVLCIIFWGKNESCYSSDSFSLKVPYCTPFWRFILGVDVLKNIYICGISTKNHLNIFVQLFSQELCWKQIDLINIHETLFWLAGCFLSDAWLGQPQVTRVMLGRHHRYVTALSWKKNKGGGPFKPAQIHIPAATVRQKNCVRQLWLNAMKQSPNKITFAAHTCQKRFNKVLSFVVMGASEDFLHLMTMLCMK